MIHSEYQLIIRKMKKEILIFDRAFDMFEMLSQLANIFNFSFTVKRIEKYSFAAAKELSCFTSTYYF